MHAINWGNQVKKGLIDDEKQRHLARGKICWKRNKTNTKNKKRLVSLSLGTDFNRRLTSATALVGSACEERLCRNELAFFYKD